MTDPALNTPKTPEAAQEVASIGSDSEILLLFPTPGEMQQIGPQLASAPGRHHALCGFGPIAAAARTAFLLAQHKPTRVILVGIAGAIQQRLEIGSASEFDIVSCSGIGAGTAAAHRSAAELGWQQWTAENGESIGDTIAIAPQPCRHLVSVCAASASDADVQTYLQRFPDAAAEDMEGFAVAFACQLQHVPLTIVRGISNIAGDRDKSRWRIADALDAAGQLTQQILDRMTTGTS